MRAPYRQKLLVSAWQISVVQRGNGLPRLCFRNHSPTTFPSAGRLPAKRITLIYARALGKGG